MNSNSNDKYTWDGIDRRDMPAAACRTPLKMYIIAVAIAAAVFTFDLIAPLGVAGGVPYVLLVLSGWWFQERSAVFFLAVGASVLTVLGYFLSPEGGTLWVVLTNRSYAIVVIWAAAIVLWWAWQERSSRSPVLKTEQGQGLKSVGREGLAVIVLSVVIAASAWGVLSRVEAGAKADIGKSLNATLEAAHSSIRNQAKAEKNTVKVWADNSQIQRAVAELLELPQTPAALANSDAQVDLRVMEKSFFSALGYRGFFVIGKNNINLASSRNKNIGVVNLLSGQGDFLDRVWAGETLVSLPQVSDVPLEDITGKMVEGLATEFVATPIKSVGGDVIAILAFRLDPDESFSPILLHRFFGKSGETYAFDRHGHMLSESRFNATLQQIGLISDAIHSDLNIQIRDPGVNMVLGQKPVVARDKQPLTTMAKSATAGNRSINLDGYRDYRGVPVVGAWLWDAELGFGIATEMEAEEAYASFKSIRFIIILFSGLAIGVLIVLSGLSLRSRRQIVESEKRYRNVINSTAEGYGKIDPQGRLLEVNKAFCDMLGMTPDEMLGKHPYEFSTGENRVHFERKISEVATSNQRQYDVVFENKLGKAVHAHVSATSIKDSSDNVTGAFAFFTDITERKEAEHELEFQKRALDEHAIVSITDVKGNITYINNKFCDISGYTRQELLGQNHRLLKSGEHPPEFYADIWRTIGSGKVWNGSIINKNKAGGFYWVNSTIVPFLDDQGKPFQYVAIRTDTTAQKQADVAMYESEKRFRAMVENAGDAIYIHDRYGKIFDINQIACDQLGYTRDELLALSVAQLDAAIDFDNLRETWDLGEADPKKYPLTLETAHRRKDGSTFPIEVRISLLPSEDGTRFVAMVRDISERKKADERIKESERLLSAAINNISDGFVLCDGDGRIVLFNSRFKALYPHSRDLIQQGALFEDFLREGAKRDEYPDAKGRVEAWLSERLAKGRERGASFDQQLVGDRWVQISIGRLPDGGWVGIHVDITPFKEAVESADKANLAKSEFLSSMSHELRTPLNAILGFAQMLEYNPKEPLSGFQKESVDHIMKGGQHLLELINDILDLARIEAGKVELSIENIAPLKIFEECLSLIVNMAKARGINISTPDAAQEVPLVLADHTRFKQVLLNFLSNAVKYNRENGTVFIDFAETDADTLRISVTDTGEGISEVQQKELFKPFSRLGAENTEIEGTGIGLVVCKDLIDLMNGTVGMESEVGKGSSFWFELPLAKTGHDAVAVTQETDLVQIEQSAPEAGGTMLYVEDNPDNLKLMELIVSRMEGLTMISTHTGELGVEMARAERPDLIILDINLPGMSGIETLKRLQSYESTNKIPVLALSAAATARDIEKGMEAGFLRYLTKPILVPEVMEAINTAMKKA